MSCAGTARAQSAFASGAATPETVCGAVGTEAERGWGIPDGLLSAIGRTESGRYDAAMGRVAAWPWTINAAGRGQQFASREDAIMAVRLLQMRGVHSIDVGCFQINLMFHPNAFGSLEQAFEPRSNAQYAARFLTDLHERNGTWDAAVGGYHSATPGVGEAYRNRVLADWLAGSRSGYAAAVVSAVPVSVNLARVTYAPAPAMPAGQPRVWAMASQAMGIRVWSPSSAATAPTSGQVAFAAPANRRAGLRPGSAAPHS